MRFSRASELVRTRSAADARNRFPQALARATWVSTASSAPRPPPARSSLCPAMIRPSSAISDGEAFSAARRAMARSNARRATIECRSSVNVD